MADKPLYWFHYFDSAVQEEDHELRITKLRAALQACSMDLLNFGPHNKRVHEHSQICLAMTDLRLLYKLSLKYQPSLSV